MRLFCSLVLVSAVSVAAETVVGDGIVPQADRIRQAIHKPGHRRPLVNQTRLRLLDKAPPPRAPPPHIRTAQSHLASMHLPNTPTQHRAHRLP